MLLAVPEKKFGFRRKPPVAAFLQTAPENSGSETQNDITMGLVYATVELINADDLALQRRGFLQEDQVRHMAVNFLVDTGAYMLTINESIRAQLDLPTLETRPAELANGEVVQCDVVGPIELRYANRRSSQCAMVLPGEVEPLLGALSLEDMDLVVEARTQRLIVNPEHPLAPQMSLKQVSPGTKP